MLEKLLVKPLKFGQWLCWIPLA